MTLDLRGHFANREPGPEELVSIAARLSSLQRLAAVLCDDWQRAPPAIGVTSLFRQHHPERGQKGSGRRAVKEDRVRTGRAHAALVLDEDGAAQGWCQYGSPEELPGIKHKREYDKNAPPPPDWRITCFYVDKKHRGQGIARAALEGALSQIAQAGGGLVEAISQVTTGREAPGHFLFSATVELFEQCGFTRGRQVGKHAWIVSRVVDPV